MEMRFTCLVDVRLKRGRPLRLTMESSDRCTHYTHIHFRRPTYELGNTLAESPLTAFGANFRPHGIGTSWTQRRPEQRGRRSDWFFRPTNSHVSHRVIARQCWIGWCVVCLFISLPAIRFVLGAVAVHCQAAWRSLPFTTRIVSFDVQPWFVACLQLFLPHVSQRHQHRHSAMASSDKPAGGALNALIQIPGPSFGNLSVTMTPSLTPGDKCRPGP
ncbi:hypothetical protein B0T16DRAFT_220153 [Cercophora newfieldiana]|uniref:Uncharacterized protein n=1 Tax=Cercophora newfieldiana TaxID=92897 RepID=A0AA39XWV1_9PEZI|nr:hypothetical protein B0T16DRAFT_220153 [Cercophora newfieldiana]